MYFTVEIDEGEFKREFHVRIRYVAIICFDGIWNMYEKKTHPQMFQDAIQAADIILRTCPTLNFVPVGRSFFSFPKRVSLIFDILYT